MALYVESASKTALADLEAEFNSLTDESASYEFAAEITVQLRLRLIGSSLSLKRLEAISPIDWPSLSMWQAYFAWVIALESVISASDMIAAHDTNNNPGITETLLEGCSALMNQARQSHSRISAEAAGIGKSS